VDGSWAATRKIRVVAATVPDNSFDTSQLANQRGVDRGAAVALHDQPNTVVVGLKSLLERLERAARVFARGDRPGVVHHEEDRLVRPAELGPVPL